jgi:hypothetical protein
MAEGAYARFQVVNGPDLYVRALPFRVGATCLISNCGKHPVFLFDYSAESGEFVITVEKRGLYVDGQFVRRG